MHPKNCCGWRGNAYGFWFTVLSALMYALADFG